MKMKKRKMEKSKNQKSPKTFGDLKIPIQKKNNNGYLFQKEFFENYSKTTEKYTNRQVVEGYFTCVEFNNANNIANASIPSFQYMNPNIQVMPRIQSNEKEPEEKKYFSIKYMYLHK